MIYKMSTAIQIYNNVVNIYVFTCDFIYAYCEYCVEHNIL
jgi:hypothetical protein